MFFFVSYYLQIWACIQEWNALKKLCLLYFFKSDIKVSSLKKNNNITSSIFEKQSTWCFWIFYNLHFFNHFWKNTQDIVFSTHYVFSYLSPSAINGNQKKKIFFAKLVMYVRKFWAIKQFILLGNWLSEILNVFFILQGFS